jgi:hypothetical protein
VAFIQRAQAPAYLWSVGEFGLQEAIEVLERDAKHDRLDVYAGHDVVRAILIAAFGLVELASVE